MTPDQIALVQGSFASIGERADDVGQAFYTRLFALDPDTRSMFSLDPAEQRSKFLEELGAIVESIADLDAFVDRATALGARHVGYGVRSAHYRSGAEALVGALGDVLGEMTEPTVEAWALAYNLVAETMMRGAHARRTGAT